MKLDLWSGGFAFLLALGVVAQVSVSPAFGQDPAYVLTLADVEASPPEDALLSVLLTNDDADIEGYEFGVCHEDSVSIFDGDVALGLAIADREFDFHEIVVSDDGWTVVAEFPVLAGDLLEAGEDLELYVATYDIDGIDVTVVEFCSDLAFPTITVDGGTEIDPTLEDGSITPTGDPDYILALTDAVGGPGEQVEVEMLITLTDEAISAWQMGVCHDSDFVDIGEKDIVAGDDALEDTFFEALDVYPGGWAGAVLADIFGPGLEVGDDYQVYVATYTLGDEVGETMVEFCDTLGDPPVTPQVVVGIGALSILPETVNALVEIVDERFLRGDVNGNGSVSGLVDSLSLLEWGFADGDEPPCFDAADVDGSNSISSLVDSLSLLQWAFADGPEPADPGPSECGPDPDNDDAVDCLTPPDCS